MKPLITPLFAYDVVSLSTNLNLSPLIKELYNIKLKDSKGVTKTNAGGYQTIDNLQENPHFFSSINFIKDIILKGLNSPCNLLSMWGNISPKYSYNHIHDHLGHPAPPHTLFSGVIYLKTNNKSGNIMFHNPNRIGAIVPFIPSNGTMLLFPSSLPHSVGQNLSDEDRISISFNIQVLR